MSDFADILADVVRITTFQSREARVRYQPPRWEAGTQMRESRPRPAAETTVAVSCGQKKPPWRRGIPRRRYSKCGKPGEGDEVAAGVRVRRGTGRIPDSTKCR